MLDPYTPTATETSRLPGRENRLYFVWIWLGVAIVGAMIATPADMFSVLGAWAFALPCYFLGVMYSSTIRDIVRWSAIIGCMALAAFLAYRTWFPFNTFTSIASALFAVANVFLGMASCGSIVRNRGRIFASIGIGYAMGLLLGPPGIVILTTTLTLIANRNPAKITGKYGMQRRRRVGGP